MKTKAVLSPADYPCSIGIEYTMIPKGINPDIADTAVNDYQLEKSLLKVAERIDRKYKGKPTWFKLIYGEMQNFGKIERGAVEYSSQPFTNVAQVKQFYDYVSKLFAYGEKISKYKFVANTVSKGVYVEGGGGHIHVGVDFPNEPNKTVAVRRNIAVFMLSNPIIQWVMADWADDDTLTSTYFNALEKQLSCKISQFSSQLIGSHFESYSSGWGLGPVQIRTNKFCEGKSGIPTVEFRCLAAPVSYQHLLDNIDLCCAIYKHCVGLTNDSGNEIYELCYKNVKDVEKYYQEKVKDGYEKEWEFAVTNLGLDYKRYKPYLKNFKLRQDHGVFFSYDFAGLED